MGRSCLRVMVRLWVRWHAHGVSFLMNSLPPPNFSLSRSLLLSLALSGLLTPFPERTETIPEARTRAHCEANMSFGTIPKVPTKTAGPPVAINGMSYVQYSTRCVSSVYFEGHRGQAPHGAIPLAPKRRLPGTPPVVPHPDSLAAQGLAPVQTLNLNLNMNRAKHKEYFPARFAPVT